MNTTLRTGVQETAQEALYIIKGYFKGDKADQDRLTAAMKVLGLGVKIEHMNQLKDQGDKSLAIRMIQFLPKDEETRNEYLKITNPQIANLIDGSRKRMSAINYTRGGKK